MKQRKLSQITNVWPPLNYSDFSDTAHLVHMLVQAIGKYKLSLPFEPQWANVVFYITSRGLTTGPIAFGEGAFNIDLDCIAHQVICTTTWGNTNSFALTTTSVAELTAQLFSCLNALGINTKINPKPQEIPNPILFHEDVDIRIYDNILVNNWWRILVNVQKVLQRYHAKFLGKTQPIGFMWGTFDIRDVRFKDHKIHVPTTPPNTGFLRRNAMNAEQIEAGWWSGNEMYPKPAFYSFTFPQPQGIEKEKIKPSSARWDSKLSLFILDYDDLRQTENPDETLYSFFESTYHVGANLAGWDPELVGPGVPV